MPTGGSYQPIKKHRKRYSAEKIEKLRILGEQPAKLPLLDDDSAFVVALDKKRRLARRAKLEGYGYENRRDLTQAEAAMQAILDELGWRYNTEHPIANYIIDFYIPSLKLAIEVDGGYHNTKSQIAKDKFRDRFLVRKGLRVIRLKNEQVIQFPRRVKATLLTANEPKNPHNICTRVLPSIADSTQNLLAVQNRLIARMMA